MQLMILCFCLCWNLFICESKTTASDPSDCKGNSPFLLQDTTDNTCFGPYGFTTCDDKALWVLNRRVDREKTFSLATFINFNKGGICLERKTTAFGLIARNQVGLGKCSKRSSKNWNFDFFNKTMVLLSTKGVCLTRGADGNANSVSLADCTKIKPLVLRYIPTSVHENGFYLKAADGSCFDGNEFRSCIGTGVNKLLWGIGVKYVRGEGKRYFFNFPVKERSNCLTTKGYNVERGPCSASSALTMWSLQDGQLSSNNGDYCVARRQGDNSGYLTKCNLRQHETISMDLPLTYTSEDLAAMVKNKDKLTAEEQAALNTLLKEHLQLDREM